MRASSFSPVSNMLNLYGKIASAHQFSFESIRVMICVAKAQGLEQGGMNILPCCPLDKQRWMCATLPKPDCSSFSTLSINPSRWTVGGLQVRPEPDGGGCFVNSIKSSPWNRSLRQKASSSAAEPVERADNQATRIHTAIKRTFSKC